MKKTFNRALFAGFFTLISASAFATTALTGFSSTSSAASGVGDVTITFTTTDANFGGAPNGGWYVSLQLPAGMTTGSTYATEANCAVNAVNFSPVPPVTPRCALSAGGSLYVANTNPGTSHVMGAGTYTITIHNVTNPSTPGTYSLQSLSDYDANTGAVISNATALSNFNVVIAAAASSIPTLSEYGMAVLSCLMALLFFKRKNLAPRSNPNKSSIA